MQSGGAQWMTAGRGVIHGELPEQAEGPMEGSQLWLNLAAKDKICASRYRDLQRTEVPEWRGSEATLRVIAGASFEHALSAEQNAFANVYRGELAFGAQAVPLQYMAILANGGDCVRIAA